MVHLLYFAWVREMVGTDSETITLPTELTTVAALLDWLATLGNAGGMNEWIADSEAARILAECLGNDPA